MVRLVNSEGGLPPVSGPGLGSGSDQPSGLERIGVVGADIIGGTIGTGQGTIKNTLGFLGEVVNTPYEIVSGEVAQRRLSSQLSGLDMGIDKRYLDMVNVQGMSISDVADQMANDGVAVSNNVAHDLALSIFLDPFNLIAAGVGKGYDVGKKSANIQERISNTTVDSIGASAVNYGASEDEVKWLKGGTGRELLGKMYSKAAWGLGGVKRTMATAMLGRGAGIAATIIGVKNLATAIEIAQRSGRSEALIEAAAVGANHVTMGAAADVVTSRIYAQSRGSVLRKAQIVARSTSPKDKTAFDEFVRVSGGTPGSSGHSLEHITAEWDELQKVNAASGTDAEGVLVRLLFDRNVAGEINEQVGKTGTEAILRAERALDEVGIARRAGDQKTAAVDEAMFLLSEASDDAGRIALARNEYVQNIAPIVGEDVAEQIWSALVKNLEGAKAETLIRELGQLIYASEVMRLGFVAKQFGSAKRSLLPKIDSTSVLSRLPDTTRPMISDAKRWTIVAKDTMTSSDYETVLKVLTTGEDVAEKAKAALYAVRRFSILRNQYDGKAFARLVDEDPAKAVEALTDTLRQYSAESFLKEVPITTFKGADEVLPELADMRKAAERGEYRIAYEPPTAASIPNRLYQNAASKDVARFGVDLWVPITDEALDVTTGNRNLFGRALDILSAERRTTTVVANVLTRMQEYALAKNLPLSREQIRMLHSRLTDLGFEQKGSIRTAADRALGSSIPNIIDDIIAQTKKVDPVGAQRLIDMRQNGELRRMIFMAAEGDLSKVGVWSKFTGWAKGKQWLLGEHTTMLADSIYPAAKFSFSPIFGIQEVIESKYWNAIRGYNSEMSLGNVLRKVGINSKTADDIRFGNKRYYDITDPATGKTERLDAVDIVAEAYVTERTELKFAQEMNAINMYFSGTVTDAILSNRFGERNESFWRGLGAALRSPSKIGGFKAVDWYKYVSTESLDELAGDIATRFEANAPVQWATWLKMAGGDRRGAALLMLRERQMLVRNRASARAVWEANKPLGLGFGRQYDDLPVKNLDSTLKDLTKLARSTDPNVRRKALDDLDKRLSAIHAEAATIGYGVEGLDALTKAKDAVDAARTASRLTVKNRLTKKSTAAVQEALDAADAARGQLRKEFSAGVARKQKVRDALIADGIAKPLATEMASLYVVAERRREMIPQVSLAVSRAMNGEALSPQILDNLKDHLLAIRSGRAPEETMWNAVMHGLDGAMARADATHFFTSGRSFLERSLNHPVFALYPTSYMFGKVLPEYTRMLYLSPTRGVSGMVLAPWMAILRTFGGSKFSSENWGKYAPLVGFNAASKIREAMVNEMGEDMEARNNPLVFMFANTLVPGLPTEVSVSASKPVRGIIEDLKDKGEIDFGTLGYNTAQQAFGIVGLGRAAGEAGKLIDFALEKIEEAGGPLEFVGDAIGDAVESLGDIIRPK